MRTDPVSEAVRKAVGSEADSWEPTHPPAKDQPGDGYPFYAVGIVHYRSYDELAACLESVEGQRPAPRTVLVLDADPERMQQTPVLERFSKAHWIESENVGFAAAANRLLGQVARLEPAARFALILNADVVLDRDYVARLLTEMEDRPEVALASGKLLRPGGERIDSAGIRMPRHRRPRDRGSEQRDEGQYESTEYVFGVPGAAMLLRCAALDDLALDGEVFDEDFFLYHEDTDLAWRAGLLGWKALYCPSARAIHARGWKYGARFRTPARVRRHSFKNHYLQMIKNERGTDFLLSLPSILLWEVVRLAFVLVRDREMLPAYRDAWRLRGRALHKRRLLQRRVRARSSARRPHPHE